MRNRSRLEIYLYLMRAVSKHRDPESIGRKVNLSSSDIEKHLDFLASQGLVKIAQLDKNGSKYELTQRGFEVLEALHKVTERESPLLKHT